MIHPSAIVDPSVVMGQGCAVWQFAHLRGGVVLGEFVSIGGHAELGIGCRIGARTRIGFGAFLPNRTIIGERVFVGPRVTFTDDRYPIVNNPRYTPEPAIVEDAASIGAGAIILPGVRIGQGAMVGAGAVVTRDVPPFTAVVGNPARPMKVRGRVEV